MPPALKSQGGLGQLLKDAWGWMRGSISHVAGGGPSMSFVPIPEHCPHTQSLDDVIKDLMAAIHRELAEKQSLSFSMAFPPNKVELSTTKADGTENFIFEFPNPDARLGFEQAFEDAKKKLGNSRDQGGGCGGELSITSCFDRPLSSITSSSSTLIFPASSKNCLDPEFLKAIPIMKTRSGMQVFRGCIQASHWSLWSSPSCCACCWVPRAPASFPNDPAHPVFSSLAVLLCFSQPRQPGKLP